MVADFNWIDLVTGILGVVVGWFAKHVKDWNK